MAPTQSKIANLKSKCSQTLSPVVPRPRLPRNGFNCQFANDFRTDADVAQPCKEPLARSLSLPVLTSARYNLAALTTPEFFRSQLMLNRRALAIGLIAILLCVPMLVQSQDGEELLARIRQRSEER